MEGNQQKMQRVITDLSDILDTWSDHLPSGLQDRVNSALEEADAALALPLRQCDVGTAEEQEVRFMRFCESHWDLNNPDSKCAGCPLHEKVGTECEFAWAQMPYEAEEGAGE